MTGWEEGREEVETEETRTNCKTRAKRGQFTSGSGPSKLGLMVVLGSMKPRKRNLKREEEGIRSPSSKDCNVEN